MACDCHTEGPCLPSLTEEVILNPDYLPGSMKGWRLYRIEYGFECSCPEGLIYLPPNMDPEVVEQLFAGRQ
jgi:hypothetical protein